MPEVEYSLTQDEIIQMGDAAQHTLNDMTIMGVIETLSQGHLAAIVASKDADMEKREYLFRQIRALQDIVSELRRRVQMRDKLFADHQEAQEAEEWNRAYDDFNNLETPDN